MLRETITININEFDPCLLENIGDNRQIVKRSRSITRFERHARVTRSHPRNRITPRRIFLWIIPRAYRGRDTSRRHTVAAVMRTHNSCSMIQHQCRLVLATVRFILFVLLALNFSILVNYSLVIKLLSLIPRAEGIW